MTLRRAHLEEACRRLEETSEEPCIDTTTSRLLTALPGWLSLWEHAETVEEKEEEEEEDGRLCLCL